MFAQFSSDGLRVVTASLESARLYSEVSSLAAFKESVLESLTGGFIAINKEGTVTEFNSAARNILKLNPHEVIGASYMDAFVPVPPLQDILMLLMNDQTPRKRLEFEWNAGPNKRRIGYSSFLITARDATILGYGITFQDLTGLK